MIAAARIAGHSDLAIAIDGHFGVDGLDPVLDPVAQIGKYDGAAGDADVLERKSIAWRRRQQALAVGLESLRRSRRSGTFMTGRTTTSSTICGRPFYTLDQCPIRLDAAGGEAIVDVVLFWYSAA